MKVFTKYSDSEPLLQDCDVHLVFSEHGGLTFSQIGDVKEAEFYKIPIVLATAAPNGSGSLGTEHCVLLDADSAIDARLVFGAAVEELGFGEIRNMCLGKTSRLADALRSSGSPIETKLLLAMWFHTLLFHAEQFFTQHQIGPYRADVAIITHGKKIVVEADGHNFHERTKEQAQHDKQRDREMQTLGWRVMRFTGSEIWKDPAACAAQVQGLLRALMRQGAA